jgi:hypothetical protein
VFNASLVVLGVGVLFLAIAGAVFRVRAIANLRPWNGPVLPLVVLGLPIFAVGLALIYFNYPR